MKQNWWNEYVGLPYAARGRDHAGVDCWGLVRLVYAEQFDLALPSFADDYAASDRECIAELVATRQEGWMRAEASRSGDLVLMRILGAESHVGVVTTPGYFLHVREGQDAVVERLDSATWKHRVTGIYRYTAGASPVTVVACPHPLQTMRLDDEMPAGLSLEQMVQTIRQRADIPDGFDQDGVIMLNGASVPREQWALTVPSPGSRVEYRALARGSAGRIIGMMAVMIAVVVFQQYYLLPALQASMGVGIAATVASSAISMGLGMVGSLLVNAIFPVRPPPSAPESAKAVDLLHGGNNRANPYGPIPVVLGKFRYTPPIGAQTYVESQSTTSYLRMVLVWGYGPLQVSDLRIGDTPVGDYDEVECETESGYSAATSADFRRIYGQDVTQVAPGIKLECVLPADATEEVPATGDNWIERTLSDEVDKITVTLYFSEGLRKMPTGGSNAGKIDAAPFRCKVQVRQLDTYTGAAVTGWGDIENIVAARSVALQSAWFNVDDDAALEMVYRWTRISLDSHGKVIVRHGAYTTNPSANPTGGLLKRLQDANFGVNVSFARLPDLGVGEEELWQVCVQGDAIYSVIDRRGTGTGSVAGCGLTYGGLTLALAAGEIARAQSETVMLGNAGEPYHKRKDAFCHSVTFNVPHGTYEVRVRRTNSSLETFKYPSGNDGRALHSCVLQAITGYANTKPIAPPKPLAMTAIRIKATNQLNGNIEGVAGTVQSICLDWVSGEGVWRALPTRNPASLLRYVLQHPANAQRVSDSGISLPDIQSWHDYCRANGFTYDSVLTQQQSLLDVLRDIAAAGRASPTMRDGKWTVIVDQPRTHIAQHFTPHNSWGFEGSRSLPKLPHGFRVQFNNALKGFQPDERIVYNDGYSAANATLFEGLTLPGVTHPTTVHKHARFHLAQLKLRPETYTLNADIEHLVCTRGDLVRVTHSVPMWGLGTGRIKRRVSSTVLELDESVPMDAGVPYTVRIRSESGASVTRTVVAASTDGYYSTIALTSGLSTTDGAEGNLFLFGSLNDESVELIVQSVEPSDGMSARITLVDYSPAIYESDTESIPNFDSQITRPPTLLQNVIAVKPTVDKITSDETVMTISPSGEFTYSIKVSFTNPTTLPKLVTHVEGQIDFAEDAALDWQHSKLVPISKAVVSFDDVKEGDVYRMRLRYVDGGGRTGPWSTTSTHTVVGKTTRPPTPLTLTVARSKSALVMKVSATQERPIDFKYYEFRVGQVCAGATSGDDTPDGVVDASDFWNDPDCEVVRSTSAAATVRLTDFPQPRYSTSGVTYRVACRMVDVAGNTSLVSALSSITITKIT